MLTKSSLKKTGSHSLNVMCCNSAITIFRASWKSFSSRHDGLTTWRYLAIRLCSRTQTMWMAINAVEKIEKKYYTLKSSTLVTSWSPSSHLSENNWMFALQRSSGGPKGRKAEPHNYKNRITCMHTNRNPCNSFPMVKIASGMDHGRVGSTTTTTTITTTTTNDVAQHGGHPANTNSCSLGLQRISLILHIHMFNWQLSY